MNSDNKAIVRLFKQWATVCDLVIKGNRTAGEVCNALQEIISPTSASWVDPLSARHIMGKNFLGIPEACEHFKLTPSKEQLEVLEVIPFSWNVLRECADDYVLVADFGLSIQQDHEVNAQRVSLSRSRKWPLENEFLSETEKPQWRLIRKEVVPDSKNIGWEKGKKLLPKNEVVPSARQLAYTMILYVRVTGERMAVDLYANTSTVCSDSGRVNVCFHRRDQIEIDRSWGHLGGGLGIASARKPYI